MHEAVEESANVPAAHDVQAMLLAKATLPKAQVEQEPLLALAYCMAGHIVQLVAPEDDTWPLGQAVQVALEMFTEYEPTAQVVHALADAPL